MSGFGENWPAGSDEFLDRTEHLEYSQEDAEFEYWNDEEDDIQQTMTSPNFANGNSNSWPTPFTASTTENSFPTAPFDNSCIDPVPLANQNNPYSWNQAGLAASSNSHAPLVVAGPSTTATSNIGLGSSSSLAPNVAGQGTAQQNIPSRRQRSLVVPPGVTDRTVGATRFITSMPRNMDVPGLEAPGLACLDPACPCHGRQWPTSGILNIPPCAMVCEVCGMYRNDFGISASNLRRHVREHHCHSSPVRRRPGQPAPARLYDGVARAR